MINFSNFFNKLKSQTIKKELKKKKLQWTPPPNDGLVRLNLGCGDKILPGYINVDFAESRKGSKPDIIADLRSLNFSTNFADEIIAIHVIEHFYLWEAESLLLHWRDVLKPRGLLILECPNILEAAKKLVENPEHFAKLEGKEGQAVMWPLYGDPAWKDPLMCHRWGYIPSTLIELLTRCGFHEVRQEPSIFKQQDPRDMRVVGVK